MSKQVLYNNCRLAQDLWLENFSELTKDLSEEERRVVAADIKVGNPYSEEIEKRSNNV